MKDKFGADVLSCKEVNDPLDERKNKNDSQPGKQDPRLTMVGLVKKKTGSQRLLTGENLHQPRPVNNAKNNKCQLHYLADKSRIYGKKVSYCPTC